MFVLWFFYWLIAVPIIIRDLGSMRIPYIYLKILTCVVLAFLVFNGIGDVLNLYLAAAILTGFIFIGVGMGDIKLLALSFLVFNSQMNFSLFAYFASLLACAFAHLLIHTIIARDLPQRIALAPSIFLAFALYFAAR
jgi:hypothetical protein